jgi:hypothetical protein
MESKLISQIDTTTAIYHITAPNECIVFESENERREYLKQFETVENEPEILD